MVQLIKNFVFLKVQNAHVMANVGVVVIWLCLLLAGVASILSQPKSAAWKIFWLLLVVCVPLGGMFLYCLWCVVTADLDLFRQLGIRKRAMSLAHPPPPKR